MNHRTVLWFVLDSYIDPKTSAQKKDLVQALGFITAGVAGAVGIFFTWRGQRITQRDQERNQKNIQDQLEQLRNELDITRRGQITERFTQAIDQLGSESLEIRLGGIYSLERTAREDRAPVTLRSKAHRAASGSVETCVSWLLYRPNP